MSAPAIQRAREALALYKTECRSDRPFTNKSRLLLAMAVEELLVLLDGEVVEVDVGEDHWMWAETKYGPKIVADVTEVGHALFSVGVSRFLRLPDASETVCETCEGDGETLSFKYNPHQSHTEGRMTPCPDCTVPEPTEVDDG